MAQHTGRQILRRLPSKAEWEALIVAVDENITEYNEPNVAGAALKSASGWDSDGNGTDTYSFSALPAGRYISSKFDEEGNYANFWSSSQNNKYFASHMYMSKENDNAYVDDNLNMKVGKFSVRCIKDSE